MCVCAQCGGHITEKKHPEVQINGARICFCPWERPVSLNGGEHSSCRSIFLDANRTWILQYRDLQPAS